MASSSSLRLASVLARENADVFRRDCRTRIASIRSESNHHHALERGDTRPDSPKDAGPACPCRGRLDFRDLTDTPKETTPRSQVPQHRMRTHCDVGGGSLRKPKILFTHASFRAPARVVAGIDAEKLVLGRVKPARSARSSGYTSRESFSLLSEAAMSRFVGG